MRVLTVQSKKVFFVVAMMVYSLKIIGLAPFKVGISSSAQINPFASSVEAFESSKIGLAYNILLVIVNLAASVFTLPFLSNPHRSGTLEADTIALFLDRFDTVLRILTACIILISWGFLQGNAASIVNRLLAVDLGLSAFEKQPFNKRALIFLFVHVLLNACLWASVWYAKITTYDDLHSIILSVAADLPTYIIYWFMMEYSTIVSLVANHIKTVNKYLKNCKEIGNNLLSSPSRNGQLVTPVPTHCITGHEVAPCKLLHYHQIRSRLFKLCEDIGDFFSLPILFCITCCFVSLFRSLFSIFRATYSVRRAAGSPATAAANAFATIFRYAYPVASLALNITRLGKQAHQTRRIVDMLLEVAVRREIITKLEIFSHQLLHENVSFTAYGFFSLDSRFLLSMLGGTATYFVALTQFPDTSDRCGEISTATTVTTAELE